MAFLEINKNSIAHNLQLMRNFCDKNRSGMNKRARLPARKIKLCVVTKCCCSEEEIINLIFNSGVNEIADSNMSNFESLSSSLAGKLQKSVIKTRLSDIKLIPSLSPHSRPERIFVSDETLLDALAEMPLDICPDIMLIAEVGDFRDGFYTDQIPSICKNYSNLPITGIAANYACLSGKMPDIKDAQYLSQLAGKLKIKDPPLVSLGGTVAYQLFNDNRFWDSDGPGEGSCNWELRCGEGIFLGCDPPTGKELAGFKQDAFTLFGEIIEIREKEYSESGNKGYNAVGDHGVAFKTGKRLNIVVDFGVLSAPAKYLRAVDNAVEIVGQTFDFSIVDITESKQKYKVGQHIGFVPSYGAVSHAMLNRYISKIYKI